MSLLLNSTVSRLFIVFFLSFLVACSSEKSENKITIEEDFIPKSEREYNYEMDTLEKQNEEYSSIQQLLLENFSEIMFFTSTEKEVFMPDRLGFLSKEKIEFEKEEGKFQLIIWQFEDSLKTTNAFYNWLDCFGNNCESLRIEEEKQISKNAFSLWVSDTTITYFSSENNFSHKEWESILFSSVKNDWNYVLLQKKNRKTEWKIIK